MNPSNWTPCSSQSASRLSPSSGFSSLFVIVFGATPHSSFLYQPQIIAFSLIFLKSTPYPNPKCKPQIFSCIKYTLSLSLDSTSPPTLPQPRHNSTQSLMTRPNPAHTQFSHLPFNSTSCEHSNSVAFIPHFCWVLFWSRSFPGMALSILQGWDQVPPCISRLGLP